MVLTIDSFGTAKNRTFFGCYAEENINPRCLCGSTDMIMYIRVRKSYFQISDFYTYCSVIYVIYNHNIINMYVLSYHLSIKIIFGVSITILSMKKKFLCIFYDTFRIHCKLAYR